MTAPRAARAAWARPLGLVVAGLGAIVLLHAVRGALPLPSTPDRAGVDEWLASHGPIVATFSLVRIAASALAAYVALVGMLAVVAATSRVASVGRLAWRLTIPSLRPLLAPAMAITLTVATALPAHAQSRGGTPPAPVMQVVTGDQTSPPVMRVAIARPVPTTAEPDAHTVAAGETFWSIAEGALRAKGHATTDAEVVAYWRTLIEANRNTLVVPGEPDLIYPGQVFVLPPVS